MNEDSPSKPRYTRSSLLDTSTKPLLTVHDPLGRLCLSLLSSSFRDAFEAGGDDKWNAVRWIRGDDAPITARDACQFLGKSYDKFLKSFQAMAQNVDSLLKVRVLPDLSLSV